MKRILTTSVAALAAVIVCCTVSDNAAFGQGDASGDRNPRLSYQILELDGDDAFTTVPHDINSSGAIVGRAYSTESALMLPVYWTVEGSGKTASSTLHWLDCGETAQFSLANGINDAGEIVGHCDGRAAYWSHPDAAPMLLPVPEGATFSMAAKINEDGVILGMADLEPAGGVGLVWRVNIEFVDGEPTPQIWGPLELPNTYALVGGGDLTDNDESGSAIVAGYFGRVWNVVSLADGSLTADGPVVLDAFFEVNGINNSGVICGAVLDLDSPDFRTFAAVLDGGSLQLLDSSAISQVKFKGGHYKLSVSAERATDINAGGVIVGWGLTEHGTVRAVVWPSADSPMVLLEEFVHPKSTLRLGEATAVNDSGLIVGPAYNARGVGFLAIPE